MKIKTIILDADDTLWHNEKHFGIAQAAFMEALAPYADPAQVRATMDDIGVANLTIYGYGARSFTLSMIETAIALGGSDMPATVIARILGAGRELLSHPVELFDGVRDALEDIAARGAMIMLTKGDLLHQEAKIAASGIEGLFSGIEIVSDKTPEVFARILAKHAEDPGTVMVAGDSMRSDVLPALAAGAWAAHIPHPLAWSHEKSAGPNEQLRFRELAHLGELASWIDEIG